MLNEVSILSPYGPLFPSTAIMRQEEAKNQTGAVAVYLKSVWVAITEYHRLGGF